MTNSIIVHETGGPEVMKWEAVSLPLPSADEVRIRHTAIGLNFIDTYFRSGLYPAPQLPFTPGNEGAGIVEAVGEKVTHLTIGDRIAYAGPLGAYSEQRLMPANRVVKIPDNITDQTAAAMMLKGMTAHYLLHRTYNLQPGDFALFHAAAGGVGLIAGQWGNHIGATMIGTVSSDQKAAQAKANGYKHVINYTNENFVDRVMEITNGKGVSVVYDSVGKDTFPASLDCIKPLGTWASFGQSSGSLPDINLAILSQKGSLFATRPSLFTYIDAHEDLVNTVNSLTEVVSRGLVKIAVNQTYPLSEAQAAHEDLQNRKTTGSTILLP